ncbi:Asp-tRNA(Asn)/Glu-tRNA(Gln) amidotransferase subunit GatC [Candidatus Parcubacteria bacterium]|nr:Asp-tRNA(Asn)/Glu-tRNA(Gln) amidotransferase subunit GatC [Candidatus Parcubacteria bacterium]
MISEKEVKHIAKLARLSLNTKEIKKMEKELSSILDYFDLLKKIDVEKVASFSYSFSIENVMREDLAEKQPKEKNDKLLKAMPKKKERYLKVKSVL